jgi:hypothetical protein
LSRTIGPVPEKSMRIGVASGKHGLRIRKALRPPSGRADVAAATTAPVLSSVRPLTRTGVAIVSRVSPLETPVTCRDFSGRPTGVATIGRRVCATATASLGVKSARTRFSSASARSRSAGVTMGTRTGRARNVPSGARPACSLVYSPRAARRIAGHGGPVVTSTAQNGPRGDVRRTDRGPWPLGGGKAPMARCAARFTGSRWLAPGDGSPGPRVHPVEDGGRQAPGTERRG